MKPVHLKHALARSWRGATAALVLLGMAGVAEAAAARMPTADRVYVHRLARHLRASGARLHGVWWCVTCREQKELFGDAATLLPYVEGNGGDSMLTGFPTWVIAGRRIEGALPLDSLAARSGFRR